jgi:acyl dehydratase
MRHFSNLDELATAVGTVIGEGEWVTVTQEMIDRFAEATGDFQWIHVDRERAAAGPFGATIAHGFLTLSLVPRLMSSVYKVDGIGMGVNYGCNRVRFTEPVRAGQRIRGRIKLLNVESSPRGTRVTNEATVLLEGSERPACIAELIAVMIPA